ncbi:hypothetical protein Tco_1309842 [Tanacetum coccineum]
MEVEDDGQGSGKKLAKITVKSKDISFAFDKAAGYAFGKAEGKDAGSGPSKKTRKDKISKKRKVLGSPSIDDDENAEKDVEENDVVNDDVAAKSKEELLAELEATKKPAELEAKSAEEQSRKKDDEE